MSAYGNVKPRANGRNIVGEQLPTLLDVTYYMDATGPYASAAFEGINKDIWNLE